MNIDNPRVQAGIKKHGSIEAYSAFMRKNQAKSRENYEGTGGFKNMSMKEKRRISNLGVKARNEKKHKSAVENIASDQDITQG